MKEDFERACQLQYAEPAAYTLDNVAEPLRESKPDAYDPKLLSLGPLHQRRLSHLMLGRHLKILCAQSIGSDALKQLKEGLSENEMLSEMEAFYSFNGDAQPETMAMDSLFLLCFLDYLIQKGSPGFGEFRGFEYVEGGLKCDIVMLENQLPLDVVEKAFMAAKKAFTLANENDALTAANNVFTAANKAFTVANEVFTTAKKAFKAANEAFTVGTENEARTAAKEASDEAEKAFKLASQNRDAVMKAKQGQGQGQGQGQFINRYTSLDKMLSQAVTKLSPIALDQAQDVTRTPNSHHLLGMLKQQLAELLTVGAAEQHAGNRGWLRWLQFRADDMTAAVMGLFIRHPVKRGDHDFVDVYNAESLYKAGVRFRSFTQGGRGIYLDKHSATLYLPRVSMSHVYTEVLLRNLMALEFNDAAAKDRPVTSYVQLMDCLVDTPDDVKLLRNARVMVRDSIMLKDSDITKMWDDMCRPFFSGRLEPPSQLKAELQEVLIKNFYKSKLRGMLKEFWEKHFRRPWTAVALLVGILLVAGDAIQTFCALSKCKGG